MVPILLQPRYWGAHLLMLACLAAAIGLGVWQYGAWSGHRADALRSLVHADPVPMTSVLGADSPFPGDSVGRPVTLSGRWLDASTLFVSHRPWHGKTGFWVVTPVRVGHSAIPVVRGWSRTANAQPVRGTVEVTGWLQPSESQGEADASPHDKVITSVRIASMTQHVPTDLYSGFVVTHRATDGTTGLRSIGPAAQPKVSIWTGLRNLLYATQWWVFGGFAIYIWWRWCQDTLRPPEDTDQPTGEPAAREDGALGHTGTFKA